MRSKRRVLDCGLTDEDIIELAHHGDNAWDDPQEDEEFNDYEETRIKKDTFYDRPENPYRGHSYYDS